MTSSELEAAQQPVTLDYDPGPVVVNVAPKRVRKPSRRLSPGLDPGEFGEGADEPNLIGAK